MDDLAGELNSIVSRFRTRGATNLTAVAGQVIHTWASQKPGQQGALAHLLLELGRAPVSLDDLIALHPVPDRQFDIAVGAVRIDAGVWVAEQVRDEAQPGLGAIKVGIGEAGPIVVRDEAEGVYELLLGPLRKLVGQATIADEPSQPVGESGFVLGRVVAGGLKLACLE